MSSASQPPHRQARPGEITVRDKRSKYSDVTPESLKKMYPTEDWPLRYYAAVFRHPYR